MEVNEERLKMRFELNRMKGLEEKGKN